MEYNWPRIFYCSDNPDDDLRLYGDGDIFDCYGECGGCDPYITIDEFNEHLSSLIEYEIGKVYKELI